MGKEMTKVKLWAARFFQIWMEKKLSKKRKRSFNRCLCRYYFRCVPTDTFLLQFSKCFALPSEAEVGGEREQMKIVGMPFKTFLFFCLLWLVIPFALALLERLSNLPNAAGFLSLTLDTNPTWFQSSDWLGCKCINCKVMQYSIRLLSRFSSPAQK